LSEEKPTPTTSTDSRDTNRRKLDQLLIIPALQVKFLSYVAYSGMGLVVSFTWSIYLFMSQNYQLLLSYTPNEALLYSQMEPTYNNLLLFLILSGASFVLIIVIMAFFFTHKIAGPIYHIDTVLKAAISGNKDIRVNLRPNDELHFLANSLNKLLEEHSSKKAS
jgi:methyl-accepting chemotaxis protein